jgi:two-component system, LytTR family, response regulator LytT
MSSNFKILIVEDEVLIAEFLKDELETLGYSNIEMAHNSKQAFEKIDAFNPDVVLLDIRMHTEREGIEIAEKINESYQTPFIFITSHSDKEIVQQALGTKPAGYITKPFKKMDVYASVHIVETDLKKTQEQFLQIKDGHTSVKIPFDDILFIQSDDNYVQIVTIQKKYLLRKSMEWMNENTPNDIFQRTHRSYIVNKTKITKITTKSAFIEGFEIPISRGNKINF